MKPYKEISKGTNLQITTGMGKLGLEQSVESVSFDLAIHEVAIVYRQ
jgi:hypothetical protein